MMGHFENAVVICSALVLIVIAPWVSILCPALVQRSMGDYTAINLLEAQGFHWIVAFTGVLILLILLIGVWLD